MVVPSPSQHKNTALCCNATGLTILTRDFITNLVPAIMDPGALLGSGSQDNVLVSIWSRLAVAVGSAARGIIAALVGACISTGWCMLAEGMHTQLGD